MGWGNIQLGEVGTSGLLPDAGATFLGVQLGALLPWVAAGLLLIFVSRNKLLSAAERWVAITGEAFENLWSSAKRNVSLRATAAAKFVRAIDLFSPRPFIEDLLLSLVLILILVVAVGLSIHLLNSHLDELLGKSSGDHVAKTKELGRRIIISVVVIELFLGSILLDLCNITNLFRFVAELSKWKRWLLVPIVGASLAGLAFFETSFGEKSHVLVAREVTYGTLAENSQAEPQSLQRKLQDLDRQLSEVRTADLPSFVILGYLMPLILLLSAFPLEVVKEIVPVGQRLASLAAVCISYLLLIALFAFSYFASVLVRAVVVTLLLPFKLFGEGH
jgi:hypothetical protein